MTVWVGIGRHGSMTANGHISSKGPHFGLHGEGVAITFPTKIPNDTFGYVVVKPNSFEELARCMMEADPDATLKAFGLVLSAGLPKQEASRNSAA
jgi:hypothetical protein